MSILQRILNKVTGQVSEEFFRSQLLMNLVRLILMTMLQIQLDLHLANYISTHTQHKLNNHIMTCILLHMS